MRQKRKMSFGAIPTLLMVAGAFVLGVFLSDKVKPTMAKIPVIGPMLNPDNTPTT